jgi:N-acylneuraminate cytidylyltransferase
MGQESKIVAFIPARGGSKSIPLKNIKIIAGRPLIHWTILAALSCEGIDEVYVATDSQEIKNVVSQLQHSRIDKLRCIGRSKQSATDEASTEIALVEFANEHVFKDIILIQATSPLLAREDLDNALKHYNKNDYDSLLSVVKQKRFIWQQNQEQDVVFPLNYDFKHRPRRQEFDGYMVENGAFYITKRNALLESQNRLSGKIGCYEMEESSYYEIDEPMDWVIVESMLEKINKRNNVELTERATKIKWFIMDCDGVLTDAGMYYSKDGEELKKFNTKDGMGIALLHQCGVKTAIITGENSQIVKRRAEKLKIDEVYLGIHNKEEVLDEIVRKQKIGYEQIAYIGDDINDLEVLRKVGLAFTVDDAVEMVKNIAHYKTKLKGGQGAVREAIEVILSARK